jgi:hypothetical protein
MNPPLQEYDTVRVVKLLNPSREFSGSEGSRPPQIGDEATIVGVHNDGTFAVEMMDHQGLTIWFAVFLAEELERVSN